MILEVSRTTMPDCLELSTLSFLLTVFPSSSSLPLIFLILTSSLAVWIWSTRPITPADNNGVSSGRSKTVNLTSNSFVSKHGFLPVSMHPLEMSLSLIL